MNGFCMLPSHVCDRPRSSVVVLSTMQSLPAHFCASLPSACQALGPAVPAGRPDTRTFSPLHKVNCRWNVTGSSLSLCDIGDGHGAQIINTGTQGRQHDRTADDGIDDQIHVSVKAEQSCEGSESERHTVRITENQKNRTSRNNDWHSEKRRSHPRYFGHAAPCVHSARIVGEKKLQRQNRQKILQKQSMKEHGGGLSCVVLPFPEECVHTQMRRTDSSTHMDICTMHTQARICKQFDALVAGTFTKFLHYPSEKGTTYCIRGFDRDVLKAYE